MKNKIHKTNNGITLIALVITIIVLLILAGVTIATLTGDNGILTKSTKAQEETEIGEEKEVISIAYSACKTNDYSKDVTDTELQTEIEKIRDDAQVTMSGRDLIIFYANTQNKYKLSQDGKIERIDEIQNESGKIIDMLNLNIGITDGGKVVYIADIGEGIFKQINTEDYTIITESGVRKNTENSFIDNEGKVYTWGDNYYGELGDGSQDDYRNIPVCISELENDLKGKNITNVFLDQRTVIALDDEGKVYTWGSNYSGQLGDGSQNDYRNIPVCISELENDLKGKKIIDVFSNFGTVVALDDAGKIYTWGDNESGRLGDGTTEIGYGKNRNIPVCISELENDLKGKNITDVFIEESTVIVLDNEGKVYTWGKNSDGQLGDGTTEIGYDKSRNIPVCISGLENDLKGKKIIDVFLNYSTVVALDDVGKIYTWGDNESGQLGDGNQNVYRNIPVCISELENDLKEKNITNVFIEESTVIVLDNEGKVYTWGRNSDGELGDGTTEIGYDKNRNIPVCISELENDLKEKNITNVFIDEGAVIVLDNEGKVYTWGSNYNGQLGDGTTEIGYDKNRNIPVCISELENDLREKSITNIYTNGITVIALDDKRKVYTWGNNDNGQLGDGTTESRNIPMCVNNIEESGLYNKNISKIIYHDNDSDRFEFIYITEDGEVYGCYDFYAS